MLKENDSWADRTSIRGKIEIISPKMAIEETYSGVQWDAGQIYVERAQNIFRVRR